MMFPWMNPWLYAFNAPWSGDVDQTISPVTSWFSPEVEFNFAGNKAIETKVVSEVASYGKQLGLLTEAVLELSRGKPGAAVSRLENMALDIERVKQLHQDELSRTAHAVLSELEKTDPKRLQELIKDYSA